MYRELAPPPEVAAHVACAWSLTAGGGRVLPDGCADVVRAAGRLVVAGPATGALEPGLAPGTPVLGVRFRVGAAGAALGLPADELRDETVALAVVWGDSAAERVDELVSESEDPLAALLAAIASRVRGAPLDAAVRAGAVAAGRGAPVGTLAEDLGLSERQVRRRVLAAVGYGPKTLARVLRLQRFLTLAAGAERDLGRLALDAGYSDQAHLGNDCRRLTGATPGALLAAGAGAAGEPAVLRG
ncbi:MAG: helix-turn-helix domain-containing protein [Solirubrobacteraceae bacterium]